MKYGVHLPNFGAFGDARVLADLAVMAEEAGWDGFFLWDHLLFCELDKNAHVDPWIALTAAAMQTKTIQLGTLVTALPRRRPWKLARESVSLQNLSGGRLILGVGLGDPAQWEYEFFHENADVKTRAEKLDEGLMILKGLWTGETFGFEGNHYHLEAMTFLPKPIAPIPIWVGGYWPNKGPFKRAARYDGVAPGRLDGDWTPDSLRTMLDYLQQRRTLESPFEVVMGGQTSADGSDWAEKVQPLIAAGATWWNEDISPLSRGWGWDELWKPWDIDPLCKRIEAGPPPVRPASLLL